eukprot:615556-Pyramimonas_sp.AAC.1
MRCAMCQGVESKNEARSSCAKWKGGRLRRAMPKQNAPVVFRREHGDVGRAEETPRARGEGASDVRRGK